MRDILFRGKRKDGTWITGCPICVKIAGQECWLIFGKEFLFDGINAKSLNHALVDPETIGQYTGLGDKDGRNIFEGDVLDVAYDINYGGVAKLRIGKHTVVYDDDCGCFMMQKLTDKHEDAGLYHFVYSDVLTVIGNIFDGYDEQLTMEGEANDT